MRALVAVIVTTLVFAMPAFADPTEDAALAHLDRGVAAFRAGDFARAHRELTAAQRLVPARANPYRWLALTDVQLGDCASALVNIDAFVARVKPDDPRLPEMFRLRALCQRSTEPAPAPAEPVPPPSRDRPITRRWWFWAAIAGTAAAATGVGLVFALDGDPTQLPPIRCDLGGCAPGTL